MARMIAVANQKGGVAKTTTVHNLGYALAKSDAKVLLVDLDPQGCLTFSVGIDPDKLEQTIHDVFVRRAKAADVKVALATNMVLDILPANIDLAGSEVYLLTRTGREHVLSRALKPLSGEYDFVLIDCPPSLGVLTINGLSAADEVLVPLQCETLSHRGVGQLLDILEDVKTFANPTLRVRGAIATMYDGRTRHARQVLSDLTDRYGLEVIDPPVNKSVRFAESPSRGMSIFQHAPSSPGAKAYSAIAEQIMKR
ncbi:MAG: AAA family ATPase [Actinobacteria bacterium]|nr:AAA family ATPase [Actinomycetota bacterium]MCL5446729.1 AAA family ATPase [Actinomycetota bacterium]